MHPLELVPPEVASLLGVKIAGGLGAMAAAAWVWRSFVGPLLKRIVGVAKLAEQTFEDWQGEPKRDGVPARPGVMARLATYDERIEGMTTALSEHAEAIRDIRYHVQPNSGTSAHDALSKKIDELAKSVGQVALTQGRLAKSQTEVAGAVDRLREDKERAHEEMLRRISRIETPHGEES